MEITKERTKERVHAYVLGRGEKYKGERSYSYRTSLVSLACGVGTLQD